ncbi:MAG: mannonate dehydratase [Anaerolineae bacterium]|nr:mannonate dehydratase [Anaerolineae bacterium]NUQ03903.1 mannonate dehydratase [Anaerolineae bacterium]
MKMTMRWYGPDDSVTLENILQVPGMAGIVSALHDLKPGEAVTIDRLEERKKIIESMGLKWLVIESIPVHESIKLGKTERDKFIENYIQSIRNMGKVGIPVLCYNFMPVFDWTRTNLAMQNADGSTALSFAQSDLGKIDLSRGTSDLPGWGGTYTVEELNELLADYKNVDDATLFENLAYFLRKVIPVAEEAGVLMAIHPDDPPWSIFGLPRIVRNAETLQALLEVVDSPHNGLTFCTGSLGASEENNLPAMIRQFGHRINFVHARNIKRTSSRDFYESKHPSEFGSVNMFEVMRALHDIGFTGPIRPDHGRMIWGESGRPGYGLYDRALGATYLYGLMEAIEHTK